MVNDPFCFCMIGLLMETYFAVMSLEPQIVLRQASLSDRPEIYEWMAKSDITKFMMGPPDYPDVPIPTWEEFVDDYDDDYFSKDSPEDGKSFIIWFGEEKIGQVNYNEIGYYGRNCVELDIWLAGSQFTGQGYGVQAINEMCSYCHGQFGCDSFILAPSLRNESAIKAYEKAGFTVMEEWPEGFQADYDDTVVMRLNYGE